MKLAMLVCLSLCLLPSVAGRKLGSEKPAVFLQEEQLNEETIASHQRLLLEQVQKMASRSELGQEFKERMQEYGKLQDQILHFALEESSAVERPKVKPVDHHGQGSDQYKYVDQVKELVETTMTAAIKQQYKADNETTERAVQSFEECHEQLQATLVIVNPIRDGGKGPDDKVYDGLKKLGYEHLACRARQNDQKLTYDKCRDVVDKLEIQRNASCEGNWTLRYKNPGPYSTGAWDSTCQVREVPYRTSEPDPVTGVDLGPVDVEGYLMEMFDYFNQKEEDYKYAKAKCENLTAMVANQQKTCEAEFTKHGEILTECDEAQAKLDEESCSQASQRHEACLAYDRCYVKAEETADISGHEYCGEHGQEAMLQLEADTLAKINCLLDALKLTDMPTRKNTINECLAVKTNYDTTFRDSLTFRLCRLRHPQRDSDDSKECGFYRSPLNDEDMSATPAYVVKYFRGQNFWPLRGSPDDATDEDNAPLTDLKKCVSMCCRRPPPMPTIPKSKHVPLHFGEAMIGAAITGAGQLPRVKSLFLPSGLLRVDGLPRELEFQVEAEALFKHMPLCGYCGSESISGHDQMVECAYCIGECCDPPGSNACVSQNPGKDKTCVSKGEHGTILVAMQKPEVSFASMRNFKSRATQIGQQSSQKWRQILARTRRRNRARLNKAGAELVE